MSEQGWHVGQAVTVVEHEADTAEPRTGGRVFGAEVAELTGIYVLVRYTHPAPAGYKSRRDQFYAKSGWRAWDGQMRWRLIPAGTGDGS